MAVVLGTVLASDEFVAQQIKGAMLAEAHGFRAAPQQGGHLLGGEPRDDTKPQNLALGVRQHRQRPARAAGCSREPPDRSGDRRGRFPCSGAEADVRRTVEISLDEVVGRLEDAWPSGCGTRIGNGHGDSPGMRMGEVGTAEVQSGRMTTRLTTWGAKPGTLITADDRPLLGRPCPFGKPGSAALSGTRRRFTPGRAASSA